MQHTPNPSAPLPPRSQSPSLFGSLRILCAAAMLAALSIVLGKYLAISTPIFRFSFENLPVLMAGIFFGPVVGGMVGAVADLVGCLMVGYDINVIVTLGATLIGVLSGVIARIGTRGGQKPLRPLTLCLAIGVAHVVGSMVVKSVGFRVYYGTPLVTLLWRVPLYLVTGALEASLLLLLTRNKLFMGELSRLLFRKKGRK